MTVTATEWSYSEIPVVNVMGTPKRRAIVWFRGTTTATSDTISVGSAIANAADIECILGYSVGSTPGAAGTAEPTWSTTTITLSSDVGTWELACLVNLT